MSPILVHPAILFAIPIVGIALGILVHKVIAARRVKGAKAEAVQIRSVAEREAETLRKEARIEAKELIYQAQQDFERKTEDRRQELLDLERRMLKKEEILDKKADYIEKKDQELREQEKTLQENREVLAARQAEAQRLVDRHIAVLEEISGLSREAAKAQIIERLTDEARRDAVDRLRKIEEETAATAEKKAQHILSIAMERCATERVVESTVSVVGLPSDEMKGRIIGREGRNIRALEAATGVDLIVDDTPEAVTLSAFDPVKREISRIALSGSSKTAASTRAVLRRWSPRSRRKWISSFKRKAKRRLSSLGSKGSIPKSSSSWAGSSTGALMARTASSTSKRWRTCAG